jgi:hypothetical protein
VQRGRAVAAEMRKEHAGDREAQRILFGVKD